MPMPRIPLNSGQVTELLRDLSTQLIHELPADWNQLFITYRSVGTYAELDSQLLTVLGQSRPWTPPAGTSQFFADLRRDMHTNGGEIWTSAKYHLPDTCRFDIAYDWDAEPDWEVAPPARFFQEEVDMFPRQEQNIPQWIRRRLPESGI